MAKGGFDLPTNRKELIPKAKEIIETCRASAGVRRSDTATWDSAHARMQVVQDRLAELHPKVITDDVAADEYLRLTEEAGRLNLVLAKG